MHGPSSYMVKFPWSGFAQDGLGLSVGGTGNPINTVENVACSHEVSLWTQLLDRPETTLLKIIELPYTCQ